MLIEQGAQSYAMNEQHSFPITQCIAKEYGDAKNNFHY